MDILEELKAHIIASLREKFPGLSFDKVTVELPKDESHGQLATNAAMVLAKEAHVAPMVIAQIIKDKLRLQDGVAAAEVAGAGFVNFTLNNSKWQQHVKTILSLRESYGKMNMGNAQKVNVEYVSCNPTGPMHVGHTRGAVLGDAIANLLSYTGFDVTKEFYINDAGSQVDSLTKTLFLRYQECLTGQAAQIPEGLYPGEYLIPVAQQLASKSRDLTLEKDYQYIRDFAISEMMRMIKEDLARMGIKHDLFFSEETLHNQGKIEKAIDQLGSMVYHGTLEAPKGEKKQNWQSQEQLLFKSSSFGDDQDRALKKADGSWTYFAAEIAYIKDKIDRGFKELVLVLGADHAGYIKRLQAAVKAFDPSVKCEALTCQLVNYLRNKEVVKMSKRAGNILYASDVLEMIGKDALRFMMLTRRNDSTIDLDVDLVREYSKDNPVFYVQYAHVRCCSLLSTLGLQDDSRELLEADLSLLTLEQEISVVVRLALWPKVVSQSLSHLEPHRIVNYLQLLASSFHSLWQAEGGRYRFIEAKEKSRTHSRMALVSAVKIVLANALRLVGVEPMEKM